MAAMKTTGVWAVQVFLLSAVVFSEETGMEQLKSLGRTVLKEMGVTELRKREGFRGFSSDAFDRVTVRADGEYLWVTFDMSVKFVPWNLEQPGNLQHHRLSPWSAGPQPDAGREPAIAGRKVAARDIRSHTRDPSDVGRLW